MISKRQTRLLKSIIKEYTKTSRPVGSAELLKKYKLNISSATVRNEMLELDKLGFLVQPHTSAGRIPTEKAYGLIKESIKPKELTSKQKSNLKSAYNKAKESREKIKELAKALAEVSKEFIVVAFADNDFYYTGLSYLFSKPEFKDQNIIFNISQVIDHLDARLCFLYKLPKADPAIYIGKENPIDKSLSLVVIKVKDSGVLIGILGLMRMRYGSNLGLLKYCSKLLK